METSFFRAFCLGFSLGFSLLFSISLRAQLYTDEVQVIEGLGGKVGIGTGNPAGILHLNSTFPQLYITGDNAAIRGKDDTWLFGYGGQTGSENISIGTQDNTGSRTLTLAAGGMSRLKILANGNVGIGTTNPGTKLDVLGGARVTSEALWTGIMSIEGPYAVGLSIRSHLDGAGAGTGMLSRGYGSDFGDFRLYAITGNYQSTVERVRITKDGNVGIGMDSPPQKLSVNGNASKSSGGNWEVNSDARLKTIITQLNSNATLDKILQLKGVTYEWADDKTGLDRPAGIQYGFTAQNIQEVFPSLVTEDNLGYLQTAYGTYDAMLIEALRALNEKIERLEVENETLRATALALKSSDEQQQVSIASLQKQIQELTAMITRNQSTEHSSPKTSQQ